MKKVVQVTEVEGEGLIGLLGKKVILFCMNYFYSGTLEGVNKEDVLIQNPKIVFDTGEYSSKSFSTAEKLPFSLYVRISAIEAYAETNKE
jgi:hypothetical protein